MSEFAYYMNIKSFIVQDITANYNVLTVLTSYYLLFVLNISKYTITFRPNNLKRFLVKHRINDKLHAALRSSIYDKLNVARTNMLNKF